MKIIIIGLTALLFLSACIQAPIKVSGRITVDTNINPNIRGQASPIQLKIFQLRRKQKFIASGYSMLMFKEFKALKGDLIKTENMIVRPGQVIRYHRQMDKDVRFIGVVANYRKLKRKKWKTIFTVSIFKNEKIVIKITKKSISIIRPIAQ